MKFVLNNYKGLHKKAITASKHKRKSFKLYFNLSM